MGWVFHSAEATVDIDVEIVDTKENEVIWSGKVEFQQTVNPEQLRLLLSSTRH